MASDIKTCSSCGFEKPINHFGVCAGYRDGHRGQCNTCRTSKQTERLRSDPSKRRTSAQVREQSLRQRYGLTVSEYKSIHDAQQGQCAICNTKKDALHVDHCHESGKVRGLLCHACNVALGRVGDNLDGVRRFVKYLEANAT